LSTGVAELFFELLELLNRWRLKNHGVGLRREWARKQSFMMVSFRSDAARDVLRLTIKIGECAYAPRALFI
jgi:hypothetical protein